MVAMWFTSGERGRRRGRWTLGRGVRGAASGGPGGGRSTQSCEVVGSTKDALGEMGSFGGGGSESKEQYRHSGERGEAPRSPRSHTFPCPLDQEFLRELGVDSTDKPLLRDVCLHLCTPPPIFSAPQASQAHEGNSAPPTAPEQLTDIPPLQSPLVPSIFRLGAATAVALDPPPPPPVSACVRSGEDGAVVGRSQSCWGSCREGESSKRLSIRTQSLEGA